MSSLLRVSEAASLALHGVAYLAQNVGDVVATRQIGRALKVSEAHLAKVLQRLAKVGLVRSVRGPGGGFVLGRPADQVTLLDVYEAIEGPIATTQCLFAKPVCNGNGCLLGGLVKGIDEQVRRHLADTRLSDVVPVFRSEQTHA